MTKQVNRRDAIKTGAGIVAVAAAGRTLAKPPAKRPQPAPGPKTPTRAPKGK
jgi:hypothetical protein